MPTETKAPASTIYVAGFLDIYAFPKTDKELILDRDQLKRALPLKSPLPLNLEHSDRAVVGCVPGVYDLSSGLFCLGRIHSVTFLSLLDSIYNSSNAARITTPSSEERALPTSPRLETLHAWFPGLSLSSLRHSPGDTNTDSNSFLHHVALCALGRRRGTVALYGEDISWLLDQFPTLTPCDRADILRSAARWPAPGATSDNLDAAVDLLVGKAIDASFIKNRMEALVVDRETVGIDKRRTYLKASQTPQAIDCCSEPKDPLKHLPKHADKDLIEVASTDHPQMSSAAEDLIAIPRSTLMNLLHRTLNPSNPPFDHLQQPPSTTGNPETHRQFPQMPHHNQNQPTSSTSPMYQQPQPVPYFSSQQPFQQPPPFPAVPTGGTYPAVPTFPQFHHFTGGPATAPPIFQTPLVFTAPPIQPFINPLEIQSGGTGGYHSNPKPQGTRLSQKRKFEEDVPFPGEEESDHTGRRSTGTQLMDLSKSIVEIQNQLKDIRESTRGLNPELPRGWGIIYPQPPTWPQDTGAPPATTQCGHMMAHQPATLHPSSTSERPGDACATTSNPVGSGQLEKESIEQKKATSPPLKTDPRPETGSAAGPVKGNEDRRQPADSKATEAVVDASMDPDPKSKLQKFFCDELLSKQ